LIVTTLTWCGETFGQLTVNNTATPTELVEQILVGQGIAVSNVTFNGVLAAGVHDQIGSFNGSASALGLGNGVLLATGRVPVVTGPNTDMSASLPPAVSNSQADPDLLQISSTSLLRDQAILEFDFIPLGDSVSFRFVFGSEEYPEFVCSQWNDVFAFFLSGPGLSGPFSNGAVNLALVPNTAIPIAINTVNAGIPGVLGGGAFVCAASDPNWQNNSVYYVDNTGGSTLQLDAFTVPMVAGARVQCGQVYHLKIAIADAGDSSVDSAVFLEGGSFSSAGGISMAISTPQADGTLTEGCGVATVTISRDDASGDVEVILTTDSGVAGFEDLVVMPTSVVLPAGTLSTVFTFSAQGDGVVEGAEELMITGTVLNACGETSVANVSVTLLDYTPMEVSATVPELACDTEQALLEATVVGGLGGTTFAWSTGDTLSSTLVPGLVNGVYSLQVTDECPRTVSITVDVNAGCELIVPNVFTPNSDGQNDAWVINGILTTRHTVRVYNRWGQVLLETDNYRNDWRGGDAPDGTYYYEVVTPHDGRSYTGSLTILGGR
jgi:gliding motility-associated-like protein